ncbi:hypothetical protein J6590_045939 [Homalodisca vitripennis]|nr:hypothetical protein J6590_045939 [Homalodisca vitripennis]
MRRKLRFYLFLHEEHIPKFSNLIQLDYFLLSDGRIVQHGIDPASVHGHALDTDNTMPALPDHTYSICRPTLIK